MAFTVTAEKNNTIKQQLCVLSMTDRELGCSMRFKCKINLQGTELPNETAARICGFYFP